MLDWGAKGEESGEEKDLCISTEDVYNVSVTL